MNKQYVLFLIVVAVVSLCFPEICGAAEEAASGGYLSGYEKVDPKPTATSWWGTLAYLVSLFAVFLFVIAAAYLTTRLIGSKFSQATGAGGRVLQNLPLGANRSVCIVELADRVLVLGVTDHNITLLGQIEDPEEIERLHQHSFVSGIDGELFSQQFGALSDIVRKIPPIFRQNSSRK